MDIFDSTPPILTTDNLDYITVVSIGSNNDSPRIEHTSKQKDCKDYITVVKIGTGDQNIETTTEEVLVYRLPGEKLGFGLKFEGGTRSAEFVRRLFIQSCAINSPASRVECSWGSLVEGDEVLEIDSVPVNTMTRTDCVRCLKDSNVVIKLLIKHRFEDANGESNSDESQTSRSVEDLPFVISAEKKRSPPPPPPVPPRKVNRKSKESAANIMIPPKGFGDTSGDKQNHEGNMKNHRLQSPYNSFRKQRQSPEVIKRTHDLNCPPDAEVYIDLIAQESAYSLSESDDTSSSISTVVDKLGSFPPTTNSSFAGSVPSTPTPIQRHIYQGEDFDFNSDTYLFSKLVTSQPNDEDEMAEDPVLGKPSKGLELPTPLQPPANFQDAPLSYGNEDVKIVKSELRINLEVPSVRKVDAKKAPSPPPRSRPQSVDVVDAPELPRLVDFVPKSAPSNNIELVREFLENEKCNFDYITIDNNKNRVKKFELELESPDDNSWIEESDFFSLDWSPSSKLATIGEDEEEIIHENECQAVKSETPIVIIENADAPDESCEKCVKEQDGDNYREEKGVEEKIAKEVPILSSTVASISSLTRGIDVDEIMEGPRQPPDGHEFPDQEKAVEKKMPIIDHLEDNKTPLTKPRESWMSKYEPQANSVRDKIAIFSNPRATLNKKYVSTSSVATDSSVSRRERHDSRPTPSLFRHNSVIESKPRYRTTANITPDLPIQISQSDYQPVTLRHKPDAPNRLHTRSMSLLDISDNTNKLDRWNQLIERRSLSKLKGLVIPENEPETDGAAFVDLPEIQSIITPVIERTYKENNNAITLPKLTRRHSTSMSNIAPSRDPPAIPKYSPAFKRRSFQIHTPIVPNADQIKVETKKTPTPPIKTRDFSHFTINTLPNDPPKSLESITSPTRSDYSFEFNNGGQSKSPIGEFKLASSREKLATPRSNSCVSDMVPSSEYDSDTDSALSSSQSSYLSKTSPPASPIHTRSDSITDVHKKSSVPYQDYEAANKRLLKPQSLEAINRKNILASARCRSGRDLKIGSPLIQRKFDDNEANAEEQKPLPNGNAEPKLASVEKQLPKEPPVMEVKKEPPAPKAEELPTPKARRENPITPKIVLKDTKAIFQEVLSDANKRNSTGMCYYKGNNLIMRKASSVTDLRKNFEKVAPTPAKRNSINCIVMTPVQPRPIKRISLPQIIPLANAVKPEEPEIKPKIKPTLNVSKDEDLPPRSGYEQLIDDAIKNNDENISKSDVKVVVLKPDVDGGSIGITLAGGADYEIKEITIHKIRDGSPAYRDGRLQKGDRVLAINGKYMKDLSHSQARRVLKENVDEVIIIACSGTDTNIVTTPKTFTKQASLESLIDLKSTRDVTAPEARIDEVGGVFEVTIVKDATGLGFSIQGGRGSPQGDVPLIIKKIFMGGAAEKAINLKAGDSLLEINGTDVTLMSRMEAWNLMKRLPEQEVIIKVRR